jgi:hypothetical protein
VPVHQEKSVISANEKGQFADAGIATRAEAAYANIREKRSKVLCQLCKVARIIDEQQ